MIPEQLEHVTVVTKAGRYCEDRVLVHTFYRPDGSRFSLGIMLPGLFSFDIREQECLNLISGQAEFLLPGETQWKTVTAPESVVIRANSSCQIRVSETFEYLCNYG